MPEAEDVLIDAAERASRAARALWQRHRPPSESRSGSLAEVERRLGFLLEACFGNRWPFAPTDRPRRAGWLSRGLGRPAPWDIDPEPIAFTDGSQLFLPREMEIAARRLLALSLAARIASGSIRACPESGVARDLFWIADGARIDAWLASELPGFARDVVVARRSALERRPPLGALAPAERAVEEIVRSGLRGERPVDGDTARIAEWARQIAASPGFAGRYRGMAPVLHWGCPRPDVVVAVRTGSRSRAAVAGSPRRTRRFERHVEPRELLDDEQGGRSGPFFVPFGDPPQTVQDPAGLRRPTDQGEDLDLETLASQLEELRTVPRIRSDASVREVLEQETSRAEPPAAREISDSVEEALRYSEWDHRAQHYRPGYCVLRERVAPAGPRDWGSRVLEERRSLLAVVRRRFERLRPRLVRSPHQRDGDELDLDAFVEDFGDRLAGRTPSDRLYLDERRTHRDVAVAFLVDASGSTDAWVSGGRTVLDVEKEAALVICEALEPLGDRRAIYAFSSRGPHVVVTRAKGFDEPNGDVVRSRIAGLGGADYTRMGAPIRHLTSVLASERGRAVRLIFLLSDGRPNDEDEYEGRYGIEDTRQAVAEARLQGVAVFCLTVDRDGSSYLPYLFGRDGYAVVAHVNELPRRLPEIYRALTER